MSSISCEYTAEDGTQCSHQIARLPSSVDDVGSISYLSSIGFEEKINHKYALTLAWAKIKVRARRKWRKTKHWLYFLLPSRLFLSKFVTSLSLWIIQRLSSAMQVKQMPHFESFPTNFPPDPPPTQLNGWTVTLIHHSCLSLSSAAAEIKLLLFRYPESLWDSGLQRSCIKLS